jgi:hypothetical protein
LSAWPGLATEYTKRNAIRFAMELSIITVIFSEPAGFVRSIAGCRAFGTNIAFIVRNMQMPKGTALDFGGVNMKALPFHRQSIIPKNERSLP